jgi:flagellar biosynthesis/type III secretory pathway chaperone
VASLLENLINVLDSENTEYKKLVILADSKTSVIVAGDIEGLEKIMEDEQAIVGTIQKMEKQRNSILADIANVVNRDVKTLKLIDLINMLEKIPDQQKMLRDVQGSLRETIDRLRALNDKNQMLLNDKLEMVNFNLNMIRAMRSAPQTANYNKDAYNDGQALGIFRGGFDTKQ